MIEDKEIFIIDDDIVQNEIHTLLLNKLYPNKVIHSFSSSSEALLALDKGISPSVIFLDLNIPGEEKTGFLAAHKDRNHPSDIYLISAVGYIDDQRLLANYPAVKDFISKPLLAHKLKNVLKECA